MGAARRRKRRGDYSTPEQLAIREMDRTTGFVYDRAAMAYHEAGHAIAWQRSGLDVQSVSIKRRLIRGEEALKLTGGESDIATLQGICRLAPILYSKDNLRAGLLGAIAGHLAEESFSGKESTGTTGDEVVAVVMCRTAGLTTTEDKLAAIDQAFEDADAFLDNLNNWRAIACLAEYLQSHEEVSGDIVR